MLARAQLEKPRLEKRASSERPPLPKSYWIRLADSLSGLTGTKRCPAKRRVDHHHADVRSADKRWTGQPLFA